MKKGSLNDLHEYGQELRDRLRLKTFPIAVKMLEREEDIPEGAVRPKRDLGCHLATCQGFALSRREGASLAMLKEDMWCSESVIGFGLAKPPQYFFDGYTRFPYDAQTLEAGSTWAHEFPRLETDKYIGIASAPLATANFEPDVVILYGDAVQLKVLVTSELVKTGHGLDCTLSTCGACVLSVVPVMQTRKCNVVMPCGGDRAYAMCQDDELIFSIPRERVKGIVSGLQYIEEYGNRVPHHYVMRPEFPMRESYIKVGKMMGMDLEKAETIKDKSWV